MVEKMGRRTSSGSTIVDNGRLKETTKPDSRWERSAPPGTAKRAAELVPDRTKG